MYDILIYLLDKKYEKEIHSIFSNEKFDIRIIEEPDRVIELCQQELFDLIMVWAATVTEAQEFLQLLRENNLQYIPVIAVADNDEEEAELLDLAFSDYIKLPLPRTEFFAIIEQCIQDVDPHATVVEGLNWQGSLEEYNLIDLIQMIEASQRDAQLSLNYSDKRAVVYFHKGKVINAQVQNLQGIDALQKLLLWSKGSFTTNLTELESPEDKIKKSNQEILIDLIQKLHNHSQLYQGLPELVEEIVKNPLIDTENLSPLQDKISNFCTNPIAILDLLLSLSETNEEILLELKELLQKGLVGRRQDIEKLVRQEQDKSGFEKFVSSISSIFKKKPDYQEIDLTGIDVDEYDEEELPPQLEFKSVIMNDDEKERLRRSLEVKA